MEASSTSESTANLETPKLYQIHPADYSGQEHFPARVSSAFRRKRTFLAIGLVLLLTVGALFWAVNLEEVWQWALLGGLSLGLSSLLVYLLVWLPSHLPPYTIHKAQQRILSLAKQIKMDPKQWLCFEEERFRFALAGDPRTLLLVDYENNQAWIFPQCRAVEIKSGVPFAHAGKVEVKEIGAGKEASGGLYFQARIPLGNCLELKVETKPEWLKKGEIEIPGMPAWTWK